MPGLIPSSPSVRVRILTAVLLTTLLGMISAGTVSYVLARHSAYDGMRKALSQENEEIKTVAAIAEEGGAGRPINGPGDVLYVAIKSTVPDPDEAVLGLVNGSVAWVPKTDDPFQQTVATDLELIAAAAAIAPDEPVTVRTLDTRAHGPLAYISVPLQVRGSSDLGHYVAVVDVGAIMAPVNRTHITFAAVCLLALVIVGLVGYQVAGRLLAPLRTLQTTAQRITETDLTGRIPDAQLASHDEVADLGRTVNSMLDRLSASFDSQRQVLDDAGHELRTPITIVRGHLELVDVDDPDDVARTRDIAVDELDRMQRLVEELLILAKSRRPDFVRVEPTDVEALLYAVLDKIIALGDRRWRIDEAPQVKVTLDAQRITQALLQLVANAVRFTAPGGVIALGGRADTDTVALWVRDEGAGIRPEDRARIFERFARGGGQPEHAGAGLGLAIVGVIAEAHHGDVSVLSEAGHGATFTMTLPRRAAIDRGEEQED